MFASRATSIRRAGRARRPAVHPLVEQRREFSQYLFNNHHRHAFELSPGARVEVEGARLITANDAGGPCARAGKRHGETAGAGEIAAGRDRHHDRYHCQPVKGARRYDKHGPAALLLMTLVRVEGDQVDLTALRYNSSLPAGRASSHARSSSVNSAAGSHWASSSSSV